MNLSAVLSSLYGWPFLVLALAVYSVTRLVVTDSLFEKQRNWIFFRYPYEGYQSKITKGRPGAKSLIVTGDHYYVTEGRFLGELLHCPWCAGFWVSLLVLAPFVLWPVTTQVLLLPLAFRVIPGMIESLLN